MSFEPIVLSGATSLGAAIRADATETRDAALWSAGTVQKIESVEDYVYAAGALQELVNLKSDVEKARKAVAAPLTAAKSEVDELAKAFIAPALTEIERLQKLTSQYSRDIAAKAEAERKAAEAKAREQFEKEQREAAEKSKQQAEAAPFKTVPQVQAQAAPFIPPSLPAMAAPILPKVAGITPKTVWSFRVLTTADLYKARPELCRLTPDDSAIRNAIDNGERSIPGLEIFEETITKTRAQRR